MKYNSLKHIGAKNVWQPALHSLPAPAIMNESRACEMMFLAVNLFNNQPDTTLNFYAMLKESKAFSSFSVNDIDAAYKFYSQKLDLQVDKMEDMGGMLTIHIPGNGNNILVYPKSNHEPATYTILNFPVDDILATVKSLKAKGVVFESYDSEYVSTDQDNIHRGGGPLIAWFKDPAGNFLSVIEQQKS